MNKSSELSGFPGPPPVMGSSSASQSQFREFNWACSGKECLLLKAWALQDYCNIRNTMSVLFAIIIHIIHPRDFVCFGPVRLMMRRCRCVERVWGSCCGQKQSEQQDVIVVYTLYVVFTHLSHNFQQSFKVVEQSPPSSLQFRAM